MSKLALELIAKEKREQTGKLDLGNCGLTELPEELFELVSLEELNICNKYWDSNINDTRESKNNGEPNIISIIPKGINKLSNLKILRINGWWDNPWYIKDLRPLIALTNLEILNIRSNRISEVSMLAKLLNLVELALSYNQISDISSLKKLSKLRNLYISENPIKSWKGQLSKFNFLNLLSVGRNDDLNNIDFLEDFKRLKTLDLSYTNSKNLDFLSKIDSLEKLILNNNKIESTDFIGFLSNLKYLNISNSHIENIDFLQDINQLTYLNFSTNKVEDISLLQNQKQLKTLYLGNNVITNYDIISELKNIEELNIGKSNLTNINFLSKLPNLKNLQLGDNDISDFNILHTLPKLQQLDLQKNNIIDVSIFQNFLKLRVLHLGRNQISDLTPLLPLIKKGGMQVTIHQDFYYGKINLHNNPIIEPPIEIVEQGNQAILNYYEELEKGNKPNHRIKMIIVGNGRVGKTSLLKRLQNIPCDDYENYTHGI